MVFASLGLDRLSAAEPAAASVARRTVLILGDSLAAGYGLESEQSFPALLQSKVDRAGLPYTVVNAGVSGDTTAGGVRRIDWLLRRPVHVLVIELGGNDGLRGIQPSETRTNLQMIIVKARDKYPLIRIVLAGMQMPPNMGAAFTGAFQRIYPDLAREHRAALVPFLLEGVGGVETLNQADRIHPTAEGQQILAANVWKVLEPVLREDAQKASKTP